MVEYKMTLLRHDGYDWLESTNTSLISKYESEPTLTRIRRTNFVS